MNTKFALSVGTGLLFLATLSPQLSTVFAQGTAFTYQGRLSSGGLAPTGSYDLRFTLYDSIHDPGTIIAGPLTKLATLVSNGFFTVTLDFGSTPWNGSDRWLEVGVRTNGDAGFNTLAQRQPVTPTPYAIRAARFNGAVSDSQLSPNVARLDANQTFTGATVFSNPSNAAIGTFVGNGSGLTNIPTASLLADDPPVVAWGESSEGQTNVPVGLSDVVAVAAGGTHGLALKRDGTVVGWGGNASGQATPPGNLSNVVAIAAGGAHSLALKSDGTGVGWGENSWGQAAFPGIDAVAIAAGYGHSLALLNNGLLLGWGDYSEGQLGLIGEGNVMAVAAGGYHSLVVHSNGTVLASGKNNSGQASVPPGLSGVVSVAAGYEHSLALKSDGTVVAWGDNTYGQRSVPPGLGNVAALSAGDFVSLALKRDGTLVAWGYPVQTNVPSGLGQVLAVSGGGAHSLVLRQKRGPASVALLDRPNIFQGDLAAASFAGNGNGLSNVNASTVGGLGISSFWQIGGNAGTTAGMNFLGTTDNQPLEIKAQGVRALRIEPHDPAAPSLIGGYFGNNVSGVYGAAIAGGGTSAGINQIQGNYGFIGAGNANHVGGFGAAVVGGVSNQALGPYAIVGAGEANTNLSPDAVIGGGTQNAVLAGSMASVIAGGEHNLIRSDSGGATVGGGAYNTSSGVFATVGGGELNTSSGSYATVAGGTYNHAGGPYSFVGGGSANAAEGLSSFAAGNRAKASHAGSFVWADSQDADFVSTAANQFSLRAAGGLRLSDDTPNLSFGTTTRQMLNLWGVKYGIGVQDFTLYFRADDFGQGAGFAWYRGGVHTNAQNNPGGGTKLMLLDSTGNLFTTGAVNPPSDRNVKAGFTPVDAKEILERVAALPITRWHYTNDATTPHLGPVAQDFKAAFDLGSSEKSIATVDADGVALAAIQGLYQKFEEQRSENTALKRRLQALEEIIRERISK